MKEGDVIETHEHGSDFVRVIERLLNDLQRHHWINLPRRVVGKMASPV